MGQMKPKPTCTSKISVWRWNEAAHDPTASPVKHAGGSVVACLAANGTGSLSFDDVTANKSLK